jgi:putative nucleotidyltransferase with HDIG domain
MTFREKIDFAFSSPWGKKMLACEQSKKWHLEGNVWNHTLLVCEELIEVEEFNRLGRYGRIEEKEAVEWAAVLHDVAKPVTTVVDNGEISTRHHSSTGAVMARMIMADLGVPFNVREMACGLIKCHMEPKYIEDAEDSAYHVIKTSCLCSNELLHILNIADINGRVDGEPGLKKKSIEWAYLWREECIKFYCFNKPYDFINDHARLIFYLKKNFQPYYKPFMDDMFDVYMLSGLPGTGKTYYAKNELKLPLVELDMAREELDVNPLEDEGRVAQLTKEMCREYLREKKPFVFSAVNALKTSRQKWMGLFLKYGARVNIIYLERPIEDVFKLNKSRDRKVPEGVILNMRSRLEIPTLDECHTLKLLYFD